METEKRYQWKRFWCPKEGSYALDGRGYLLDPKSEYGKYSQTDVVDWDAFANTSCLALLGEPGIGKTHALEDFKSQRETQTYSESNLLYLNLRDYGSDERLYKDIFESGEFNNWINSTKILEIVLDSLDECLIHVKTVAPMLITEFKKYPVSRLRLRIGCRTSEWPALLHQELPRIWGADNYREYELAPLRRDDVVLAARGEGLDADVFLKSIEERDLVPFAIKPITLVMLLQQCKRPEGLGGSIVELYRSYCLYLCQETSVFRRDIGVKGLLEPPLRLAIAERIAAITMFCKRASIYKGLSDPEADDVALLDIAGGTESINGTPTLVTEVALRDVLGTGLFAGGIGERHVWRHWTYAEFLAARYLIRYKLSSEQISDLIFSRQGFDEEGGRVVPQLKETAAWLAAMNLEVFKEVLRSDPQILLRSFIAGVDASMRKELTDSLLQKAVEERIIDFDLRQHYKVLAHPGLADQLRPYVGDPKKGFLVRRIAIDIAEACDVVELLEDLINVALDQHEDIHARFNAAHAVLQIGDTNAKLRLRLLLNAGDIDKDDELKGCALKALWPYHITAEELFSHITKPKRENFFGMYKLFLMQELMPHLKVYDLPVALTWVQRQPISEAHEISILQDFTANILEMAWNNLDDGEILEKLTEIAIKRIENYEPILGERDGRKKPSVNLDDTHKRHRLVKAILPRLAGPQIKTVWEYLPVAGLVTQSDFPWLMEQISASKSNTHRVLWAKLALMIFDWNPQQFEELWNAKETFSSLEEIFAPLFTPIELDSDRARQLRKIHRWQMQAERSQDRKLPRPPLRNILDKRLNKFEGGDINSWWILTLEMTCEARDGKYFYGDELQSDLTSTPGWATIDEPTRLRVVQAAYEYLLRGDPHTDDWFGKNIIHRPAAAGYKALLLLQKLSPERLNELSDEVWKKWSPIVLAYPESPVADAKEPKGNLVTITYRHVPSSVIKVLLSLIDKENEDHGHIFVLRKMDEAWDAALENAILEKAEDPKLKAAAAGDLVERLFEKGQSIGKIRKICVDFLAERSMPEGIKHEKAIYCGALLLIYGGEKGWEIIQKILDNEPDFGCKLIAEVARGHDHAGIIMRSLSERSVADLYIWLAEKFPQSEDPEMDGAHFVGPRETIAHLRDALLSGLREKGTPEAVTAIRRITQRLPNLASIKFIALQARQTVMQKSWGGNSPKEILNLIRSNDNRLVDNEEQLLGVVIASLRRYQESLLGENSAVYDLWNTNDWTPKEEAFISDHVKRHLDNDLRTRGIVVNREVQIRRGQETDIHIVAIREKRDGSMDQVKVITEVKGCWHPKVKTAMQTQLRDRYLRENQCGHGLYLVAWFLCHKWKDESRKRKTPQWTLEEAQRFFQRQAIDLSRPGEMLRAMVLDTRLR